MAEKSLVLAEREGFEPSIPYIGKVALSHPGQPDLRGHSLSRYLGGERPKGEVLTPAAKEFWRFAPLAPQRSPLLGW
jgi:hypothetical protein